MATLGMRGTGSFPADHRPENYREVPDAGAEWFGPADGNSFDASFRSN